MFFCFSAGKHLRDHLTFCGMQPKKSALDAMPFLLGAHNKARAELIIRIKDDQVDAVLLPGRSNQTTLICLLHQRKKNFKIPNSWCHWSSLGKASSYEARGRQASTSPALLSTLLPALYLCLALYPSTRSDHACCLHSLREQL